MKLIVYIAILTALSCGAQNPIVSIDSRYYNTPEGAYFKDTNNEFNKFEGTWVFTNNNSSFTIILEKREQVFDGEYYEDILIGEYKYIENGNEIINLLPLLSNQNIIGREHKISGRQIIPNNLYASCDDCLPNERRVKLYFKDPERRYLSTSIILRYLVGQTNPEKMTATIIIESGGVLPSADSPATMRIPLGEYLMVKQ